MEINASNAVVSNYSCLTRGRRRSGMNGRLRATPTRYAATALRRVLRPPPHVRDSFDHSLELIRKPINWKRYFNSDWF